MYIRTNTLYGGFILQTVTIKKKMIISHVLFMLILLIGFGLVVISNGIKMQTQELKIYFVDAQMMRLMPVKTEIPKTTPEKMAQHMLNEIIVGHDENPKIRRLIPNEKNCMTVKVRDKIAYVDMKQPLVDAQIEGRDLELLTIYSIVNSLTGIDGIVNVRFTINGDVQKDFKGHIDMRETFIPDYFI